MSSQATHLVYAQVDTSSREQTADEAIYAFTGGVHGADLRLSFGLFALVQGDPSGGTAEAGRLLREMASYLLRDIYIPLLPWQTVQRPNPLDALMTVMEFDMTHIAAVVVAVIVDHHLYLGWQGEAHAYLLNPEEVEPLVSEDETPVISHTMTAGNALVLCTCDLYPCVPAEDLLDVVYRSATLQAACNQLAHAATVPGEGMPPLVLLAYRPD